MRKPYYFCVLVLAVIAIFSVSKLTPAAEATGDERFVFVDRVNEFFGLQSALTPVFSKDHETISLSGVPVSLPVISALPGAAITVPITVGNTTGLGIISYDFQVTFDPAVVTPASPPFDRTGTLSSVMLVTPNAGFPGHLIITGFQATSLTGSGTLLFLKFNVIGSPGQSTALAFENYTDPNSGQHPAFTFNEGQPPVMTTNGSFTVSTPTPTATNTSTPTNTATSTPTNTATNTPTPTATGTFTPTPTSTSTFTPTPTNTATNTPTNTPTVVPTPTLGNYPATNVVLSGNVTITPDAPPTMTTSMSVETATGFVGELTADPLTGVVRVTNAHHANIPPGAYAVTVRAFGPGGAATGTFMLTVTNGTACNGNPGFTSPAVPEVTVGTYPLSVVIGDFNGDGIQDVATANYASSVSIRLGNGSGGFILPAVPEVMVGTGPFSVAIGDFNGDGIQDFAAANNGSDNVSIRLGNGNAGFISPAVPEISVGSFPSSVAIGDFNGDAIPDLVTANPGSNSVSIRLGNGSGGFTAPAIPEIAVGALPQSVAIGDFNGDGMQDFATVNYSSSNVSIRLGDGSGGFISPAVPEVTVSTTPQSVAIGDFNGDGNEDFITANYTSNSFSIRLGNGGGGFTIVSDVVANVGPISVAIGDFNNDGNQDFVGSNRDSATVSIRLGNGSGGFTPAAPPQVAVAVDLNPISVAVGDFNGDGIQDFATANNDFFGTANNNSTVSIRLGGCFPFMIDGIVTYGNATVAPTPRFVSNVTLTAVGSTTVSTRTDFPDGTYSLEVFGPGPYTVTPSKTGGINTAINSFDAGKIAAHVSGITSLTGNQLVVADVSNNGSVSSFDAGLIARYVTGTPGSGLTGTWKFLPVSKTYATITGNLAGEDYTAFLMGEVSGNWTNTGARPGGSGSPSVSSPHVSKGSSTPSGALTYVRATDTLRDSQGPERSVTITLPNIEVTSDKDIIVPITVEGVEGKGIIAYEFDLRYDPSVIKPQADPVDVAGTVSRGLTAVVNASEPGILRVAVYGPMPIDSNGVLLNLKFTAVGATGSVSPLTWERIMFNDGEPRTVAANGQVEITKN